MAIKDDETSLKFYDSRTVQRRELLQTHGNQGLWTYAATWGLSFANSWQHRIKQHETRVCSFLWSDGLGSCYHSSKNAKRYVLMLI